jgi:DNA repair photolyase
MNIVEDNAKSILTETGGFLHSFTHTINPYNGCQLGLSLCGYYCYARAFNPKIKSWGNYLIVKSNADILYRKEYAMLKDKPKIFMSSVTDPYPPIEYKYNITRKILESMIEFPPMQLVIQTHTPNPLRDLALIDKLNNLSNLSIHISIETDMENKELVRCYKTRLRHIYSIKDRLEALRKFRDMNIRSVATISPLLPLLDPHEFAERVNNVADYVILDHFLLGDGSNGTRTSSYKYFIEPLPIILYKNGYLEWNGLDKFYEIVDIFKDVLGANRVGISREGFNSNTFIE